MSQEKYSENLKEFNLKCCSCGALKIAREFKGLYRRQPITKNRKVVGYQDRFRHPTNPDTCLCRSCELDSYESYKRKMYLRIKVRNVRNFNADICYTYEQFVSFLDTTQFEALYRQWKKKLKTKAYEASGYRPSVDRINSWGDYSLDNIQIITCQQNASKGNSPAIGARHITMRFFKKLRESKGLSKYEMAQFLGMLPSTYYYYEDEAKGCSFEILCLLRSRLKLTWQDLGALIETEYGKLEGYEQIPSIVRRKRGRPKNKT